jgi:predicted RNA binding protein YcfA (HicA-like mRNA interferase family)
MKPENWSQIRNITADELIRAIEKDGWKSHPTGSGSRRVFVKKHKLISVHYHPHKVYGPDMLKDLLRDIGWDEKDMKRLKLIK